MSKLRKVDREVMVHEQSELETEKKESNKMRRQTYSAESSNYHE